MYSTGIDIKFKCPKGESGGSGEGRCIYNHDFTTSLRNVYNEPKDPDYKVCRHKRGNLTRIKSLTYGRKGLTIAGDGYNTLIGKHSDIKEVCTYYHKTYDSNNDIIRKPLLLKIQDEGGENHWYSNADADKNEQDENEWYKGKPNTRWKLIQSEDDFPTHYPWKGGSKFTKKLNDLTCELHNLHYVDISRDEKLATYYSCKVCGKYTVTISKGNSGVDGYTKYNHEYTADVDFVKYSDTVLEWRHQDDKYNETFPLESDKFPYLTVYYWDQDKGHTRPLLMQAALGEIPVSLGNDRNVSTNDSNKNWSMIEPKDDIEVKGEELIKALHKFRCKLFSPVIIDVSFSQTGGYENKYCEREGCHGKVTVENYSISLPELANYAAFRHTYKDNKTFTVTGFTGGPSLDEKKLPIFDVTEVVVFFASCQTPNDKATETPLLIYIESEGGKTKKWYSRCNMNKNDGEWTVESRLGSDPPQTAYKGNRLEDVLNKIGNKLDIRCIREVKTKLQNIEQVKQAAKPAETRKGPNVAGLGLDKKLLETVGGDIGHILGKSVVAGLAGAVLTEKLLEWANTVLSDLFLAKGDANKNGEKGPTAIEPEGTPDKDLEDKKGAASVVKTEESVPKSADPKYPGGSTQTPQPPAKFLGDPVSGGILAGAGYFFATSALACFAGYKYYKSYRGDPWVINGYPIESLKNVPC